MLSRRQEKLIDGVKSGIRVSAKKRDGYKYPKNWTFHCEAEGLYGGLYICFSAWALMRKGKAEVASDSEGYYLRLNDAFYI